MCSDRLARLLLTQEIAGILYAEAELLDERRHDEWLALLAEDIRYWMPMRRNVKYGDTTREFTRESEDISWFDEGKETLTRRVRQIQTGIHWAEEPQSRITHMVSNVQLLEAVPNVSAAREVTVKSRFLIYNIKINFLVVVIANFFQQLKTILLFFLIFFRLVTRLPRMQISSPEIPWRYGVVDL